MRTCDLYTWNMLARGCTINTVVAIIQAHVAHKWLVLEHASWSNVIFNYLTNKNRSKCKTVNGLKQCLESHLGIEFTAVYKYKSLFVYCELP